MKIDAFVSSVGAILDAVHSTAPELNADHRDLIEAVKAINSSHMLGGQEILFTLDRWTQRAVMRVIDRETREVVRQIPAEAVLRMAADLKVSDGFRPHDHSGDG